MSRQYCCMAGHWQVCMVTIYMSNKVCLVDKVALSVG